MHDSERAIPRVEVVEVDCQEEASGFQKRDETERYAANLAQSILALTRNNEIRPQPIIHLGEILSHSVCPFTGF